MASKIHKFAMICAMYAVQWAGLYTLACLLAWQWFDITAVLGRLAVALLAVSLLTFVLQPD